MTTRSDVIEAQATLQNVLNFTPLLRSHVLTKELGGRSVFLKCENLQHTGSFKARGAYWRMYRLSDEERSRGVVAASAGNHAQGVALAARKLKISATVVMPKTAPLPKIVATERYLGEFGQVKLEGETVADAIREAREIQNQNGSIFVHPYDHEDVIAGQGTVGLEIAQQCPEVKTVVVPVGGGGLAAGIAVALADHESAPKVVGVQALACAPYPSSLITGEPVPVERKATIADGIAVTEPGKIPLGILQEHGVSVLTVTEDTLYSALILCLERSKQLVEPAGVAAFGALLQHSDIDMFEPPVVVVLSGGNIDTLLLAHLLRHGMPKAGRALAFRCRLADEPGSLAKLLSEVGDMGANLIDVRPERVAQHLLFHQADVLVHLETKGETHCSEIISRLQDKGYEPERL
ncbi:threonine ammonia-lyase [Streptomyces sp. NPDC058251]|uniref:threonine ammonia-lyase n=1 Tax=Streptomyces sp. NPDC058251 TaxID=3346404 RepID=UPI0036E3A1E2